MRKSWTAILLFCIVFCFVFLIADDAFAQCEIQSIGLLGKLDTEHLASEVVVSGSYAYLATGEIDQENALHVIDISDPATLQVTGSVSLPESSIGLAISGTHVYYASIGGGLYIIDVSNSSAPALVSSLIIPTYFYGMTVSGSYVYIGDHMEGLRIVDISNPSSPQTVGLLGEMSYINDVAVSGGHAYLAGLWAFDVVDVSDPTSPRIVGSVDLPNYGYDVAIVGSHAFVATSDGYGGGLAVIDISDPTSPAIIASLDHPWGFGGAVNLDVSGDYAYLAYFSLTVVNISDPANPFLIDHISLQDPIYDIAVSDSRAYVTCQTGSCWLECGSSGYLQVLDVSSVSPLPVLSSVGMPRSAEKVAVAGSHAYVTTEGSEGNSLEVVDISSPQSLSVSGSVELPLDPTDIAVSEPYAYVGVADGYPDYTGRLEIIDVSDPGAPSIAGEIEMLDRPYGVAVSGTYVYVVDRDSLLIMDVSDPPSAGMIGLVDAPSAECVVVRDGYAYVGSNGGGLYVIDVSDPTDPQLVGSVFYGPYGGSSDLTLSGSYAYIADYNDVWVIDISDPTTPFAAASVDVIGSVVDIEIYGNYALASSSAWVGGLIIIDISNPLAPYVSALAQTEDYALGVAVSDSIAYLAGDRWGSTGNLHAMQLCPNSGGTPAIGLDTISLTASNDQGVNPPDQQFELWNSGSGTLSYMIYPDVWWLTPDPFRGGSLGEHDTIDVSFNTSELSAGEHTGKIIVADTTAANGPQYIDVTVTVYPTYHTLSTNASPPEAGSVNGGGTYGYGERVEIEALPNVGWEFDRWQSSDADLNGSTVNPVTIRMNADITATAIFTTVYHDLTVYSYPGGAGVALGTGSYAYGSNVVLNAESNYGWRFSRWQGHDIGGSTRNPEWITMNADKMVTAVFEVIPLTHIFLLEPANGSVCYTNPTFWWTSGAGTDTGFSVDISFSPYGPYYSTWNLYGTLVPNEYWGMPLNIWNMIPSGSYVFWRVRGIERGVRNPTIVYSNEVWFFYKP
jgi:hypothetical protein